jgi:hypothetical protein
MNRKLFTLPVGLRKKGIGSQDGSGGKTDKSNKNLEMKFEVRVPSIEQCTAAVNWQRRDNISEAIQVTRVVRVLGYRSEGPGSIPGTTRKNK